MTPFDPEFDPPRPKPKFKGSSLFWEKSRPTPMALGLIAAWLLILWNFGLIRLFLIFCAMMLSGVAIIALAMIPSFLGYCLFGLYDRLVLALRNAGRWPDDDSFPMK